MTTGPAVRTTRPRPEHRPAPQLDVGLVVASAISLAIALPGSSPGRATTLVVALAAFAVVWFTAGRRSDGGGPTWTVVAVALVAVCAAGAAASPAFAVFQVVAFPIAWTTAPGFRRALVLNVAVAIAVGTGYALGSTLLLALAVEGVSLAFSIAMGLWIGRIEAQSEERQRLVERLTAAQAQIAAMGRDAGAAAERQRLSRELHDTLTQTLAGVVMLAEGARARHPQDDRLAVLEEAARTAIDEARGLVAATADVPLTGGLDAALRALAERFRRETGLAVETAVDVDVPRGLEVVLLRCAQEGLANARKHADARLVRLRIREQDGDAVLTVADDGRGPGGGEGFGLPGMRDRLALVGGTAALTAGEGGGAVLTARVPLQGVRQ